MKYPRNLNKNQIKEIDKAIKRLNNLKNDNAHLADKGIMTGLIIRNLKKLEKDIFDYHYSKGKYISK